MEVIPQQDEVIDTTDGNERFVSFQAPEIRTIDDLLKRFHINSADWTVVKSEVNSWSVGAKSAKKRLTWQDGKIIDGEISDPGQMTVVPMFQVKVWLIKSVPVAILPTIQPICIDAGPLSTPRPIKDGQLIRSLHLADPHVGFRKNISTGELTPFHDRKVLSLALQVAQTGGFDNVFWHGDVLDLAEWSEKYLKSPEFYWTTQPALVELSWWIAQFVKACPNAKHVVLEGNHDTRLETSLVTHLMSAYQLKAVNELSLPPAFSLERLLCFHSNGVEYIKGYPDAEALIDQNVRCIHGDIVKGEPGATAAAVADKACSSTIFGHVHRIELATRNETWRGERHQVTAFCPGCMCRVDGVVPGHRLTQQWQQGIGVSTIESGGLLEKFEAIPIRNGRAIWKGRVFEGNDSIEKLVHDTDWQF